MRIDTHIYQPLSCCCGGSSNLVLVVGVRTAPAAIDSTDTSRGHLRHDAASINIDFEALGGRSAPNIAQRQESSTINTSVTFDTLTLGRTHAQVMVSSEQWSKASEATMPSQTFPLARKAPRRTNCKVSLIQNYRLIEASRP